MLETFPSRHVEAQKTPPHEGVGAESGLRIPCFHMSQNW